MKDWISRRSETLLDPQGAQACVISRTWGLSPTEISECRIVFETENWYYCIVVVERGDMNRDGIEDLLIHFTDDSIEGTYLTEYVYLLVRLSEESDLIAVAHGPSGSYYAERDPVMSEGIIVPWSEQNSKDRAD